MQEIWCNFVPVINIKWTNENWWEELTQKIANVVVGEKVL